MVKPHCNWHSYIIVIWYNHKGIGDTKARKESGRVNPIEMMFDRAQITGPYHLFQTQNNNKLLLCAFVSLWFIFLPYL
ncbi:MAG: hypothetical protein RLZZ338_2425 [Cyanobacteriota bacterium]|jgi:hypothetical protein